MARVAEVIVVGRMDHVQDHTFESANRVYSINGISPTVPTCVGGDHKPKILVSEDGESRIRKITPRECGRLMNVQEESINKMLQINSSSQCYKQFGNSIVVSCLIGIFSQLHIQGKRAWNDMSDDEIRTLIYKGCFEPEVTDNDET